VENALKEFNKIVINAAKATIPRGNIKQYKPFWNKELEEFRKTREEARKKSEITNNTKDVQTWRRSVAQLRKEIIIAKRKCYTEFLQNLYYRNKVAKYITL
jgi:hypothetical protein